MEFETALWEATQKGAQERTGEEWRALAQAVFGLLKGDREQAEAEMRVLRAVLGTRAEELGAGGVGVLRGEIAHRERSEKRLYDAMTRAYDVMSPARAERATPEHFDLVQECAQWYGLVPTPAAEEPTEEQPAPRPKCPHAHIIRRFAQCAEGRGFKMADKEGRRRAFCKLLGRELESCAELSAEEWQAGQRAMVEGRMSW